MSAAFLYARILNGLSPLISSRSATSRKTCATAGLSNPQTFGFDAVLENAGTLTRHSPGDVRLRVWGAVEENTAPSACAADLGSVGPGGGRAIHERVDVRRCDAGSQSPSIGPLDRNLSPDLVPVLPFERRPHGRSRIANALEAVEYFGIAVQVSLGNLPVVRAGVARCTGIGEHNPSFELDRVHVQADAADAGHGKLDGRHAAVERGSVVLDPGGHANRLTLDIHCHLKDLVRSRRLVVPPRHGPAGCNHQGGRARNAGPRRRLAAGRDRGAFQLIVAGRQRQQWQLAGL